MTEHDDTRTSQADATVELKQCPECGCKTFAQIDELGPGGRFVPGNSRRCVNCKHTFGPKTIAALASTPNPGADTPSMEAVERAVDELASKSFAAALGGSFVLRDQRKARADLLALIRALPGAGAEDVCSEIREIVAEYRRQEEAGSVDTPGGLEHMGDVWRLLEGWNDTLASTALRSDTPMQGQDGGGKPYAGAKATENGLFQELPENVIEFYEREARNITNLWADAVPAANTCVLAYLLKAWKSGHERGLEIFRGLSDHPAPALSVPADVAGAYEDAARIAEEHWGAVGRQIAAFILQRAQAVAAPAASPSRGVVPTSKAAQDILAERRRQVEAEGWTEKHDDHHAAGQMAEAAAVYALVASGRHREVAKRFWPWDFQRWKPASPRRNLVKAAALIVAEIERLDRLDARIEEHFPAPHPEGTQPQPRDGEG